MKTKVLLLLASALFVMAQVIYVPENKPVPFQWDHDRRLSSPGTYYQFYVGTNLLQKVTTNDFVVVGTNSNGTAIIQASIIFPSTLIGPNATNQLSVTAFDPVASMESDHTTNILLGQVVGKPLPPQGNRNP
jgi:hypothetical protein